MHCKPSLQNSCHQKVSEKKSSRNIERRFAGNDAEGHYYWSQKWPPIFFIFNFAQYSVPRIPSRRSYFCQMSKLCQRRATRILQNVTTAESLYNTCRAPCDKICLFNHHPSQQCRSSKYTYIAIQDFSFYINRLFSNKTLVIQLSSSKNIFNQLNFRSFLHQPHPQDQ